MLKLNCLNTGIFLQSRLNFNIKRHLVILKAELLIKVKEYVLNLKFSSHLSALFGLSCLGQRFVRCWGLLN